MPADSIGSGQLVEPCTNGTCDTGGNGLVNLNDFATFAVNFDG